MNLRRILRAAPLMALAVFALGGAACSQRPEYRYKPGDAQDFVFDLKQTVEPDGDRERAVKREIWGRLTLTAQRADAQGYAFELRLSEMRGRRSRFVAAKGEDVTEKLPGYEKLDGLVWTLRMDRRGRTQRVEPPAAPPPEVADIVLSTTQTFRECWPSLPDKIERDARWTRAVAADFSLPGDDAPLPLNTEMLYAVDTLFDEPQRSAALRFVVRLNLGDGRPRRLPDPPGQAELAPAGEPTLSQPKPSLLYVGEGGGQGEALLDLARGRLERVRWETRVQTRAEVRDAAEPLPPTTIVTHSAIELRPYSAPIKEPQQP